MIVFPEIADRLKLSYLLAVLGLLGCDFPTFDDRGASAMDDDGADRINRFWFEYKWSPERGGRLWEWDGDGI